MADEELNDEEFTEEADDDLPEDDLDADVLDDDAELDVEVGVDVDVADDDDDDEIVAVVVEEEDPVAAKGAAAPARSRKKREEDEDDDDDEEDDDVEADLDTILKDRIAATPDDDEDDEIEGEPARTVTEVVDGVQPKKANEFMCTGCFLLVNAGQFGPPGAMECPVGESACPAIEQLTAQAPKARR